MSDCGCGKAIEGLNAHMESLHRAISRLAHAQAAPRSVWVQSIVRVSEIGSAAGTSADVNSIGPPQPGTYWLVRRIGKTASTGTPTLQINVGPKDNPSPSFQVDFSLANANDQADENSPIHVSQSDYLVAVWGGATASSVLTASYQLDVYRVEVPAGAYT